MVPNPPVKRVAPLATVTRRKARRETEWVEGASAEEKGSLILDGKTAAMSVNRDAGREDFERCLTTKSAGQLPVRFLVGRPGRNLNVIVAHCADDVGTVIRTAELPTRGGPIVGADLATIIER